MTRVVTWPSSISALFESSGRDGSSGKTSQVFSAAAVTEISPASSQPWLNSGMGTPIESWTLVTSEYHNRAEESMLSDILETGDVPQRYFFSPGRCSLLLERMEKHGLVRPAFSTALRNTVVANIPSVAKTSQEALENTGEADTEKMEDQ
jgi:hypothetical protein